jgi:hypothetical protein
MMQTFAFQANQGVSKNSWSFASGILALHR